MLRPSDDRNSVMLLLREVLRALELHVLDEMRQPQLVVVFEHRPRLDDEPQLGAAGRLRVRRARSSAGRSAACRRRPRVDRHLLRQGVAGHRRGGGFAAGQRGLRRGERSGRGNRGSDEGGEQEAKARERHPSILTGNQPPGIGDQAFEPGCPT